MDVSDKRRIGQIQARRTLAQPALDRMAKLDSNDIALGVHNVKLGENEEYKKRVAEEDKAYDDFIKNASDDTAFLLSMIAELAPKSFGDI